MQYSRAIKESVLKQVLPPNNRRISEICKEFGICDQTIRNWIKSCKSDIINKESDDTSPRFLNAKEKYHLLMEAAKIPEESLGEFLRQRGLHSEHLTLWDQELREMVAKKRDEKDSEIKELKKTIKGLQKELNRKDKALAETAALLVLKKNWTILWGITRTIDSRRTQTRNY